MDPTAIYAKTAKGIEEIKSRTFRLPPRARALLIMVDGRSTGGDVIDKGVSAGNAAAFATLADLEAQGFIAQGQVSAAAPGPAPAAADPDDSLEAARRYALDHMVAVLGPHAATITALESAKDLASLVAELEKCRTVLSGIAGAPKAARFWADVEARLKRKPAAAPPGTGPLERSLDSARRYAIEQMRALPAPHGPAFVERLETAADRATLVSVLERCRNGFQILVSDEAAERFWTGAQQRLP